MPFGAQPPSLNPLDQPPVPPAVMARDVYASHAIYPLPALRWNMSLKTVATVVG